MTAVQICALIALIALAALLVWEGYRMGYSDGKSTGMKEGQEIQYAASAKNIRDLKASLHFITAERTRLAHYSKRLEGALAFSGPEQQALLEIAEKLRIAAETFSALRTGKKLERDTRALRDKALDMAQQLAPFNAGDAA
jgi:hypothetical protein